MNELDPGTNDILLVKISPDLDASLKHDMADRVMRCIPSDNPVLLIKDPEKFNSDFNVKRFRRPLFIFMILNFSDLVIELLSIF
jgi:hypothetical protein